MSANLYSAERRRLEEINTRIAALRVLLSGGPAPNVTAPAADWFDYLSQIKRIQGNAANDLAFVTALMARDFLVRRLSLVSFDVAAKPQGASGLDIDAVTTEGARVIAEIKATIPHKGNRLGAQQIKTWRTDFDKLNREDADYKFFFVADSAAFNIVRELYALAIPGVIVVLLPTGEEFTCPTSPVPSSTSLY